MIWESTMPSILGYVSGLLWNQNNVDSTASPVTTQFEVDVGNQLCKLMRFGKDGNTPWGHITSCGSVANLEAMWSARNAKLHPLALQRAINNTPSLQGLYVYNSPFLDPYNFFHISLSSHEKIIVSIPH